ncbi:MAG: hypothetical protein WD077_03305 [Bacteroidia bacterium]
MKKNFSLLADSPEFLAGFFTEDIYHVQPVPAKITSQEPDSDKPPASAPGLAKKPFMPSAVATPVIRVLMTYPGQQQMPAKDKNFLMKVLSAVKLDMKQVKLINIAESSNFDFAEAIGDSRQVITLGLEADRLPEGIAKPGLYDLPDLQLLCVWDLTKTANDKQRKRLLWEWLQIMFPAKKSK